MHITQALIVFSLLSCIHATGIVKRAKSLFEKVVSKKQTLRKDPHFIIIVAPHGVDRHALLHHWIASHLNIFGDQYHSFDVESELMHVPAYVDGMSKNVLSSMPKDPNDWWKLWKWSEQVKSSKASASNFATKRTNQQRSQMDDGSAQFVSNTWFKTLSSKDQSQRQDPSNQSQFKVTTDGHSNNDPASLKYPLSPEISSLMGVCQRGEALYAAHSPNILLPLHGRIFEKILENSKPSSQSPTTFQDEKPRGKKAINHLVYFHNTDVANPSKDTERLAGMIKMARKANYSTALVYVNVPNKYDLIHLNYALGARIRFACPETIRAEVEIQQDQFTTEWMGNYIEHKHYKHLDHLIRVDLSSQADYGRPEYHFQERFHVYKRKVNKVENSKEKDIWHDSSSNTIDGKTKLITQWFLWTFHGAGVQPTVELLPIVSDKSSNNKKDREKNSSKHPVFSINNKSSNINLPGILGSGEGSYRLSKQFFETPSQSKSDPDSRMTNPLLATTIRTINPEKQYFTPRPRRAQSQPPFYPTSTFATSNIRKSQTPSDFSSSQISHSYEYSKAPSSFYQSTAPNPPNITVGTASGTAILLVPPTSNQNFSTNPGDKPMNPPPSTYPEQQKSLETPQLGFRYTLPPPASDEHSSQRQSFQHTHQDLNCSDPNSVWYNTAWCRPSSRN